MTGAVLAADLVNLSTTGPWTPTTATAVLERHQIRRPTLDEKDSAALHSWAADLHHVFTAADPAQTCAAINQALSSGTGQAYLTTHDALRPHLHFAPEGSGVVARVKAVTAGGLAVFVVESGGDRLGTCDRTGCTTTFVDTSRNGRRAYCSARCGNAEAVKRHRTR